MNKPRKMPVLILSSHVGATQDLAHAITARAENADIFRATTMREAQRQVRHEQFVAIVALEPHFVPFCDTMVPNLTAPGSILDIIIAKLGGYETLYGITEFRSVQEAAAEVHSAITYQRGEDDMGAPVLISAPPVQRGF